MSNIIVKDEYIDEETTPGDELAYDWYRDLALYYTSDHKVWIALWDQWKLDGEGGFTNYSKLSAREFLYEPGNPRQRYLWREIDPSSYLPTSADQHWTDYFGNLPYQDFSVNSSPGVTEQMRYLPGAGIHATQEVGLDRRGFPIAPIYLHGDLTASTMLTTERWGGALDRVTYTAFGELIPLTLGVSTRYQYAGGYGYECGLLDLQGPNTNLAPITLQHVGYRWYQPGIGRFVQRDPIGLRGGMNVYVYCGDNPLASVDPSGLGPMWPNGTPRPAPPASPGKRVWVPRERSGTRGIPGIYSPDDGFSVPIDVAFGLASPYLLKVPAIGSCVGGLYAILDNMGPIQDGVNNTATPWGLDVLDWLDRNVVTPASGWGKGVLDGAGKYLP